MRKGTCEFLSVPDLTISQRQANQNLQPLNVKDSTYDQRIDQIRRQTQSVSPNPEVKFANPPELTVFLGGQFDQSSGYQLAHSKVLIPLICFHKIM